jgi:hypothetical protein
MGPQLEVASDQEGVEGELAEMQAAPVAGPRTGCGQQRLHGLQVVIGLVGARDESGPCGDVGHCR